MIYEVLNVSPDRVDELCRQYLEDDAVASDSLIQTIRTADLSMEEKMVLSFAVGFMSAVSYDPNDILVKYTNYVH